MNRLNFYLKHSWNDLRVNGQRTFFALLCIAAGVAAIVSLQTLAGMISNTLTDNLQRNNRGDIQFTPFNDFGEDETLIQQGVDAGILTEEQISFLGNDGTSYYITEQGLNEINAWLSETYPDQVTATYRQPLANELQIFFGNGPGTSITDPETGESASQLSPIVIESTQYPFYNTLETQDDTLLSDALSAPNSIVVSDKITATLPLNVGDEVRIGGSTETFTITGIVDTDVEVTNPIEGFLNSQFGFYYLDVSSTSAFDDISVRANTIFLQIENPTPELVNEINDGLLNVFPYFETTTTEDLRENYTALSDAITDLVTVMGLVSMLLGSIGIINTMQVIVRRRTVEIAVLKTIGLQADQVTYLFLIEAIIMGIIGSIAGVILGWGATFLIRGVAESVFTTDIPFRIVPAAAANGVVIGIVVTTIFGFMPTLTAGQVRPGIVLRPSNSVLPRAGILRTLAAFIVIILVLIGLAYSITGNVGLSAIAVVGSFIVVAILYGILNGLIWIIGKFFPGFGSVDLKISLRQMAAGRSRAAVTLLALVIGVFSLSLVTLFAQSISNVLENTLENSAGGNISVSVGDYNQLDTVTNIIDSQEGVNDYRVTRSYSVEFVSLTESDTGEVVNLAEIATRLESVQFPFGGSAEDSDDFNGEDIFTGTFGAIDARAIEDAPDYDFVDGRGLTAEDEGQSVAVVSNNLFVEAAGITAGDVMRFEFLDESGDATGEFIDFTILGVQETALVNISFDNNMYAPIGGFPEDRVPSNVSAIVDIDEDFVPELRREMSVVPGAFLFDTAFITAILNSLLGTFTAFPTLVAILGLIVGGVVIANSVALTTMERRGEIAVMKAVGLQRERVLGMILMENGVLGIIGGLVGVGIGLIVLLNLVNTLEVPRSSIPIGVALLLMGLCVVVSLVAAITTAWNASGEKPLNVLRYE